jgi:hypothetical protein
MAEHTVDQAADFARLAERPCVTRTLNIHGFHPNAERFGALSVYGSARGGSHGAGSRAAHGRRARVGRVAAGRRSRVVCLTRQDVPDLMDAGPEGVGLLDY